MKHDIKQIEEYYTVSETGKVYSKVRNRELKPHLNSCGYVMYFLQFPYKRWFTAHSLVAYKYIGQRPDKHDINHIDNNKQNNHFSNLEYVTHSENVKKSYLSGRKRNTGKRKPHSDHTKELMSKAKQKRIKVTKDGKTTVYNSLSEACNGLGWYPIKLYRAIKQGGYKDYSFEYC